MTKDDFTADAIQAELIDHTINHDFPDSELSEIGSRVYIPKTNAGRVPSFP